MSAGAIVTNRTTGWEENDSYRVISSGRDNRRGEMMAASGKLSGRQGENPRAVDTGFAHRFEEVESGARVEHATDGRRDDHCPECCPPWEGVFAETVMATPELHAWLAS